MTGKTVVMNALSSYQAYRSDYSLYDEWFKSRNEAFMLGYAISDIFKYLNTINEKLPDNIVFNRACGSWYVYSRLYDDQPKPVPIKYVYKFIDNLLSCGYVVTFIYVRHKSKESAKRIFDYESIRILQRKSSHIEKYDKFKAFTDYIAKYSEATKLYGEFFKLIESKYLQDQVKLIKAYTISSKDGSAIDQVTSVNLELLQFIRDLGK